MPSLSDSSRTADRLAAYPAVGFAKPARDNVGPRVDALISDSTGRGQVATIEEVAARREICAVHFGPLEWIPRAGNNHVLILHGPVCVLGRKADR
jgi:hypothetical protein